MGPISLRGFSKLQSKGILGPVIDVMYLYIHLYKHIPTYTSLRGISTIIHKMFETNSGFHVHHGKGLISVFQEIFARISETSILAGKLDTRLSFYKV